MKLQGLANGAEIFLESDRDGDGPFESPKFWWGESEDEIVVGRQAGPLVDLSNFSKADLTSGNAKTLTWTKNSRFSGPT